MICAIVTIAGRGYPAKAGLMEGEIGLLPLVDTPEKERAAKALLWEAGEYLPPWVQLRWLRHKRKNKLSKLR